MTSSLTLEQRREGEGVGTAWRQVVEWRESRRVGQNEVKEMRGWRSCWTVLPKYGFCTLVSRITSISFIWFDRHENVPLRSPNTGNIIEQQSSYCTEIHLASHSSKAAFHRLPQPRPTHGTDTEAALGGTGGLGQPFWTFITVPLQSILTTLPSVPPSLGIRLYLSLVSVLGSLLGPSWFSLTGVSPNKFLAYFGIYFSEDLDWYTWELSQNTFFGSNPRPNESETSAAGPSNVCFNKPFWWFCCIRKFEDHHHSLFLLRTLAFTRS